MIATWHILIQGFAQDLASPSGMEKLWSCLRDHSSERTSVMTPRQWDDDWKGLAAFILRVSVANPKINIYGFSWGAGWGFIRLAKRLLAMGLKIAAAVLADPIYRSPYLPTWLPLNPLSLISGLKIIVPRNVREVHWTFQANNKPSAHRLVAEDANETVIHPGLRVDSFHTFMDSHPAYHAMALKVAKGTA